ncbi:2-dehydropantoate 2-reductase [Hamadaea tsunoensis]|uniref:2-dehydropantoate 2-reductase n=1 Tax=Hamadaea tsunoensis TaxID=53368 RepID=UPI000418DEAC|nr:2-dehydropantoate 2-reductase [Hamadaea tsunoensis]
MRILVVGAGATGGFFGARLHEAGRDVTFLVRPARAEVLRRRGLRITGVGPDTVVTPNLVTASEVDGPYDLVLLTVKATALTPALQDLKPAVGTRTTIVPFLNGMAHMDTLNDAYGREVVLGGVVRVITTLSDDGDIVQLAPLADIAVGEQDGARSERVERVAAVLGGAGFDFAVSGDILTAMWHKWIFISTLGALNTLARGSVGEAVAVPGGADLGARIAAEGAAVAAAAGHPVPQSTLDGVVAFTSRPGSTDTASLYRDLVAGRATEVEQILGDLTARASASGVATPLLDLATLQLRIHENRRAE